jgi:hypothetical protein
MGGRGAVSCRPSQLNISPYPTTCYLCVSHNLFFVCLCFVCSLADPEVLLGHLRTVVSSAERVQGKEFGAACVNVVWALVRSLRLVGPPKEEDTQSVGSAAHTVGTLFAAAATKYLSVKNSPMSSQVGAPSTPFPGHVCCTYAGPPCFYRRRLHALWSPIHFMHGPHFALLFFLLHM